MTWLGNFSWWPNVWVNDANRSFTSSEINKTAVLKNVRRTGNDLILFAEHGGVVYTGKINTQLSEDFLILLRHILLQHWGEPLSAVKDVEVNFAV
jgi:hypothetical protein